MIKKSAPPVAEKRPQALTIHDDTRQDNYYWLREKGDPEVIAYLEAENEFTTAMTEHTVALQAQLYDEMLSRIQETDSSAPVQRGQNYYYTRTVAGLQYQIHCRKVGTLEAPEEVLLDENALASGQPYFRLGLFEVSPNQQLIAYSTDTSGDERYTLHFLDLNSGTLLSDEIPDCSYAAVWANDNKTLFYTMRDEAWRDHQIRCHALGSAAAEDAVLFQEDDGLYSVHIDKTKDDAFLIMTVSSIESSEQFILSADDPEGSFQLIEPRRDRVQYYLSHHQGVFYVYTNESSPNFKVMRVAASAPDKANWQPFIPHDEARYLSGIEPFADHLIIYGRAQGLPTVQLYEFASKQTKELTFPEPVYSYSRSENPEAASDSFRLVYHSLTTADSTYDIDMATQTWTLRKQMPVLGDYDPDNYVSERLLATAADGTLVPISLVYRQGVTRAGPAPCLLYGYGSYGANIEPRFNANRLSLLDRGFIFAIAHIRGSKTMGRSWYDQGKWLHKRNTFTDFIACARHLMAEKYTSREKLVINGRSAGGLLMGAVVTMAPELFAICVAGVPFVDVVTTMLDESIPLTIGEFEEWGNPKDETYYRYMLSYSPYDNTSARAYPHILITAGLNDPRVQYWEPAKWTAKLRDVKQDDNDLLLKTFMGAGHFSSSGRYNYLKDIAFEYAFILDKLGLADS